MMTSAAKGGLPDELNPFALLGHPPWAFADRVAG
jgi:hypothetical protein